MMKKMSITAIAIHQYQSNPRNDNAATIVSGVLDASYGSEPAKISSRDFLI